jgi:hypothetical protein
VSRLLRLALLAVIAALLVSVVIGIGAGEPRVIEKLVLGAVGVLLVLAAARVPPGSAAGAAGRAPLTSGAYIPRREST